MERIQSSESAKVMSDEELENTELETDIEQTRTSDDSEPDSLGEVLEDDDLSSGINTDRSSSSSTPKNKKKVRFTDDMSLQRSTTSLEKQDASTETDNKTPKVEVQEKSSLRRLAEIKIDLSKLVPASNFDHHESAESKRYALSSWGSSLPAPKEPDIPGSTLLDLSLPGPSFTSEPIPGSSQSGTFISGREAPQPQRRQFPQIDPFEEDSYVETFCKDVPDGPYLKPTESECLFKTASKMEGMDEDDLIEWDFDQAPITNLCISDSDFEIVPRPKTPTPYQRRLDDDAPPHIFDPYTQSFIPLNNGDQIEVVADIHEVPTPRERSTQLIVRRPVLNPVQRQDLEAIECIPCDDSPREMISEMDYDEAAFQDWVSPPSPDLPPRRHSF